MEDRGEVPGCGPVELERGRWLWRGLEFRQEVVEVAARGADVGVGAQFVELFLGARERGGVVPEHGVDADVSDWPVFVDESHGVLPSVRGRTRSVM